MYARPKADLVKEAAAVPEADTACVGAGKLNSNLAIAAVSLPGHLAAPRAGQTCGMYVLSQGLLTLTSLYHCMTGNRFHVIACICVVTGNSSTY